MTVQDTLDGMPRKLWTCTPTRLDAWLSCPRRYRFTYLDRRQKGLPWAHNSVGSSVHNALRDWWLRPAVDVPRPRPRTWSPAAGSPTASATMRSPRSGGTGPPR